MSGEQRSSSADLPRTDSTPGAWECRLPPSEFCWAVISVEGASPDRIRQRSYRATLEAEFQEHLAIPIQGIATAFTLLPEADGGVPGAEGRVLACGIPVARLTRPDTHAAVALVPSDLPAWAKAGGSDAVTLSTLNVLTGMHEPKPLRKARATLSLVRGLTVAMIATVAAIGLGRSAAEARRHAAEARTALSTLAASAHDLLPGEGDPNMRALRELDRLSATRVQHAQQGILDASEALEVFLARWPDRTMAKTTELAVTQGGILLRADVPDNEHAAALTTSLMSAFEPASGGSRPTSEILSAGDKRQVRVQLPLPSIGGGT